MGLSTTAFVIIGAVKVLAIFTIWLLGVAGTTLAERKLAAWIQDPPPERVIALDGGFDRIDEIRETLRQANRPSVSRTAFMPLAIPAALLLSGLIWRPRPRKGEPEDEPFELPRVLRMVLPGVYSAQHGAGGRGYVSLLVPAALLALPFSGQLGNRLPWGLDPGTSLAWTATIVGLLLYLAVRWYLGRERSRLIQGAGR